MTTTLASPMDVEKHQLRVLMVSNHYSLKKQHPFAGVFVDRQVESLRKAGIKVATFDTRTIRSPRAFRKCWLDLRKEVKEFNPDLVHAQYGSIVGFLAVLLGRPAVISYCGNDLLPGAGMSRLRMAVGFVFSNLSAFAAESLVCKSEELQRALWWRHDKVSVIPNGVDLDLFSPGPQDLARKELQWNHERPVVLFVVGSNPRRKGKDLAEAAMQVVRQEIPPAELCLLYDVQPNLMPQYYRAADVLLCTSRREGSPNVVKEALACNLPIVSTPVGDVPERLNGVQPSVVVPRDAHAIGEALVKVLLKRRRSNGREHVAHLGLEQVAQRVLQVYQSVLGNL